MDLCLRVDSPDGVHDLQLTCDPAATIGTLAHAIAAAGFAGAPPSDGLVIDVIGRDARPSAPGAVVCESDVRSGDIVRVVAHDVTPATPHASTTSSTSRPVEMRPGAVLVVDGPDAGRVFPLRLGDNTVGTDAACTVQLTDPTVARLHARIAFGATVEVVDSGSAAGVTVDGAPILGAARVEPGAVIATGATRLLIDRIDAAPPAPARANTVAFNPPPRIFAPYTGAQHEVPGPPSKPSRHRMPWISALVPLLMGAGFYAVTRSVFTIVFLLLSPVLLVASAIEGRRHARKDHREALAAHATELDEIEADIAVGHVLEREHRNEESPPIERLLALADDHGFRLWERDAAHGDALSLRIGTATLPSRSTIVVAEGSRPDRKALERRFAPRRLIDAVALTAPMLDVGMVGIAGGDAATGLARALVMQAACLHSPAGLAIAAAVGEHSATTWDWLKWLPHVHAPRSQIAGRTIALRPAPVASLVEQLERIVAERASAADDVDRGVRVLVVLDDDVAIERARLTHLLEHGPAAGIVFIWVSRAQRNLPAACGLTVVASSSADASWVGFTRGGARVDRVRIEGISTAQATAAARALAPVVDVTCRRPHGADLPVTVSLAETLGDSRLLDDPGAVRDRWAQGRSLRAVVGQMGAGALSIDLRADGPHALVAGTTGAGKSELLQTFVTSLALTHGADRVTFLLVDYKGGAAFKECVLLPHCVGLVTDLNAQLVRRALVSLDAEIRRREHLLSRAGAKDLLDMEAAGLPDTPPSLVIVVDEFAALAKEIPEFVDGVVNIAQRGRSLGLHLVLATQRPAGVITDNVRANTNLRIALRVADDAESTDVLGVVDAAALDRATPGRAIAKVGPRELLAFQAAYVGGRTDHTAAPDVQVLRLELDRTVPIDAPDAQPPTAPATGATDLERFVATIAAAHHQADAAPIHRPWLDPLPDVLELAMVAVDRRPGRITIGMLDLPEQQAQVPAVIDLAADGSVLVFGGSRSGKTVLLRTIAASLSAGPSCHVHAIDAAGRGLGAIEALPHVGSVVPVDDHERAVRLLRILIAAIDRRAELLARSGAASLDELHQRDPSTHQEARIVLLVDGYPALRAALEGVDRGEPLDLLTRIVAEGRACGVHAVLTADRRAGVPSEVAAVISRRIVLRMADPDEYAMLDAAPDAIAADAPPGRGMLGGAELQVAILGSDISGEGQAASLRALASRLDGAAVAPAVPRLAGDVRLRDITRGVPAHLVPLGLGGPLLEPVAVDLTGRNLCIFGPQRSGRTTALRTVATGLAAMTNPPHRFLLSRREASCARPWSAVLSEPSELARLVDELRDADDARLGAAGVVIFVDDMTELDGAADDALADLLRLGRSRPVRLVVAADAYAARRTYGPLAELRNAKHGLLLQPDLDNDGDLFSVRLPRRVSARFPQGRAFYVDGTHVELVQVAVS
jgi:S-DNA-T family DNA segregation ATPase FtsK/SpoIIIE